MVTKVRIQEAKHTQSELNIKYKQKERSLHAVMFIERIGSVRAFGKWHVNVTTTQMPLNRN